MKIWVGQNELLRGIHVVQKAVPTKSVMPILKGILIVAENNKVKLVANDMQLGIETTIKAQVIQPGRVVIDSKIFGDIVRRIKDEYVEFSVDEKLSVEIKCENLEMKIVGFNANDFPDVPKVREENTITVNEGIFSNMIKQTVFAVSKSEHLQVITGELIEIKENEIIMAATDGYRFALRKQLVREELSKDIKVTIPGNSLMEIGKLLSGDSTRDIKITLEDRYALFVIDDTKIVTRLLQGKYLNHDVVMPKDYDTKIIINTKDLLDALEITSIFAQNSNTGVRFSIRNDKLKIFSNADIGHIVKEINTDFFGEDLEIAFNISYLIEGLRVIDDEEIEFCFSKGSKSPGVIKPISDKRYEYLILPIRINEHRN